MVRPMHLFASLPIALFADAETELFACVCRKPMPARQESKRSYSLFVPFGTCFKQCEYPLEPAHSRMNEKANPTLVLYPFWFGMKEKD